MHKSHKIGHEFMKHHGGKSTAEEFMGHHAKDTFAEHFAHGGHAQGAEHYDMGGPAPSINSRPAFNPNQQILKTGGRAHVKKMAMGGVGKYRKGYPRTHSGIAE